MAYRASFWTAFFVDLTYFLIILLTFSAIFDQVESIGGWSLPHMVIFVGTFTILDGLYMSTYFFGVLSIPDKIRAGGLDLYLVKPTNALLLASFESMDFGSILLVVPGIFLVGWGANELGIQITPLIVFGYILLMMVMYVLMYLLMVLLRVPAFWLVRINAFQELENGLVEFSFRIPGVVYQGFWKALLYVILPYGLMATIPTQYLTGGLEIRHWLLVSVVFVVFIVLTTGLWRRGIKRYGSASS
jgi:ABC-2 type transport system permease protein